jgi:hypothetical protein
LFGIEEWRAELRRGGVAMDREREAKLQDALQNLKAWEDTLERYVKDAGPTIRKHFAAVTRGQTPQGMSPEVRDAFVKFLSIKANVENAVAQVAEVQGFPEDAAQRREERDKFWEKADEVRAKNS